MSGQYPGGYNSPHGGHRGQFNPQQQQQMMNQMGQGAMEGGGGGNAQGGGGGAMMPMGGYAGGGGMQQQQQQQPPMGMGMQSPSQQQQMMSMQQQQQMQMQHQQQQMAAAGGGAGGMQQHMGGMMPQGGMHMQQQQQHMNPNMQQPQMQGGVPNQGAPMAQQHHQHGAANGPPQQQHLPPPPPPQQQPPHPQHPQTSSTGMLPTTMTPHPMPHKEINIVQLSRLGQETVQDITSRFQEVFSALKIIQPSQNRDNNTEKKVQENFRTIRLLFKRVRIIYEKCNDGYPQGMEFAHVESLIPLKDDGDHRNEGVNCEEYRKVMQENQELIETVKLKNRQLREIIDRTRIIIWEINTMLAMRRS